jgi:HlyD family secretion protein
MATSMDRPIQPRKWRPRRIAVAAGIGLAALVLLFMTAAKFGQTRVRMEPGQLAVAQVKRGEFQEYIPVQGTVQPSTTVYLDLEEGGIVERVYVQAGSVVKKGDLILSFSNTTAQKENIETETRLLENLDQLRNSKLSITQSNLILKDQLLDLNYKIRDLEKTFARYKELMRTPAAQISKEQFESADYQLTYYRGKRDLLEERIRRESELEQQQSKQIDQSIERVTRNLDLLARIVDSLEVRAPIDGVLSTLDAEVGQSFQRGQRVGQIDRVDAFKVNASIDQYYLARVRVSQRGKFEFGENAYSLEIKKIYPEVSDGSFHVDMAFLEPAPAGLKRGQTLQINLGLSETHPADLVEKGEFYRYTNGRWVYLLAPDGWSARRVRVVLGRQNPQAVEVLDGLKRGDWIITSNYGSFHDADAITFESAIKH